MYLLFSDPKTIGTLVNYTCKILWNWPLFGENYEGTSDSYYSLGITQYEMGDFRFAQRSHQHALDIRLNLFGKDHVKTADSYRELGATSAHQNDYNSVL